MEFVIQGQYLYFYLSFEPDIIRKLKEIPENIRVFDAEREAWKFDLSVLPIVEKFLPIPPEIKQKYQEYLKQQEIERKKPDLIINVGASYCSIKINKKNLEINWNIVDEVCAIEVPNAKYTNSYKEGTWDGKYHLFIMNTKRFPSGLLPKVLIALDLEYYKYELHYEYQEPKILDFQWQLHNIDLRDYQIETIKVALDIKRGILQLATGAGKTILSSGLIQQFGVKTLFLVHTKDLLYQAYYVFKSVFANAKIGIIGDGNLEIGDINVATIQTLSPKLAYHDDNYGDTKYDIEDEYTEEDIVLIKEEKPTNITTEMVKELLETTKLLIVDECQHIPAQTMYKIVVRLNTPYKFGLSATPYRDDGFQLKIEAGLGKIIYKLSASELIDRGYLIKPHIKCIIVPQIDYPRKVTYNHVYSKYIVENPKRNEIISLLARNEMDNKRQVLILVKQIKHLNTLQSLIPNSVTIEGKMRGSVRKQIISDFRTKKFQCLIATTLADEGLDVPCLDALILAGSGKSSTKALQRIGRVIRLGDQCPRCQSTDVNIKNIHEICKCKECGFQFEYHGKTEAIVYDFVDQTKWLYEQYHKRLDIYETEPKFEISKHNVNIINKYK